jgi:Icc-related predicted phosphoesterase
MTRLLAFSDLHASEAKARALLALAEDVDLVVGAGDFCNMRQGLQPVMDWLAPIAGKSVLVPGNAESADELRAATTAVVLHGNGTSLRGLRFFGIGYAVPETPFGGWSCDLSEDAAAALLAGLEGVDVLISHSPPKGIADVSSRGESLGSEAVRDAVARAAPRYCLCGHIHDSWGGRGRLGATEVINLGPSGLVLEL